MSDEKNTSSSKQETVSVSSEDPQKIEDLQKQLQVKDNEIKQIKEKTIEAIQRIKQEARNEADVKTDLTKKVIKQNTFKHNFRNGYADGTVEKLKKKILADRKKAKTGIK